jgi:dihydropteroate synthase
VGLRPGGRIPSFKQESRTIMTVYRFQLHDEHDLRKAISLTGADARSMPYFDQKREILAFHLADIDFRAANALKQEMLSRNGDAIVHRGAIDGSVARCDVVLMGTRKAFRDLLEKLGAMPYWGLDTVREELGTAIESTDIRKWEIPLPGRSPLHLGGRTAIMGIVNANDSSFYSGSRASTARACADMAETMDIEGADIIDLGAESTRPGSTPLSGPEERDRLIPAIRAVRERVPEAIISADTYRADTAFEAIQAGADMINDISGGLFDPLMFPLLARTGNPVVIMHAMEVPDGMHKKYVYRDLIGEIASFFSARIRAAADAGISPQSLILDPGIGFSKNSSQSLEVIERVDSFFTLGRPVLVGHSRKSSIGRVLELDKPS